MSKDTNAQEKTKEQKTVGRKVYEYLKSHDMINGLCNAIADAESNSKDIYGMDLYRRVLENLAINADKEDRDIIEQAGNACIEALDYAFA